MLELFHFLSFHLLPLNIGNSILINLIYNNYETSLNVFNILLFEFEFKLSLTFFLQNYHVEIVF